jgi:hypothetical protein
MAVEVLKSRGVPEDHILFLNLIASPEGVSRFAVKFPRLTVVTAFIDEVSRPCPILIHLGLPLANTTQGLDEKKYGGPYSPQSAYPLTNSQLHSARPRRLWRQVLHNLRKLNMSSLRMPRKIGRRSLGHSKPSNEFGFASGVDVFQYSSSSSIISSPSYRLSSSSSSFVTLLFAMRPVEAVLAAPACASSSLFPFATASDTVS